MFSMSTILMSTSKEKKLVQINMQGGQNVRIGRIFFICNPKIVRIVRIFILEIHRFFLNFHSFQFETKKEGRGGGIEREKV